MEPCVHTDTFSRLAEVYRCVETAARPRGTPAEVARWMFPQLCGGGSLELTRIGVTLVGKVASCVTVVRSSLRPEVTSYFTELLNVLYDDMDLMPRLVSDQPPLSPPSDQRWVKVSLCPSSTRWPTLRMRIRLCHTWLPRVHQHAFFSFFTSRLELHTTDALHANI